MSNESSSETISVISEEDSSDIGLQEEVTLKGLDHENEVIDDENCSNEDGVFTGQGDPAPLKVFDSKCTGRPTINRFKADQLWKI